MTSMDNLQEIIKGRRSIGKVKADPVPKELVEKLIEAATWAPNHYATEPWKFVVMTGEGRRVLGQAYADIASETIQDLPEEERKQRLDKEMAKAFRAPVVIAAICVPSQTSRISDIEDLAAVQAAVQNMLLMAHACGLGAVWRSGDPMYHPKMKKAFRACDNDQVVGLIYVGYPDMHPPVGKRISAAEKTVWLEG